MIRPGLGPDPDAFFSSAPALGPVFFWGEGAKQEGKSPLGCTMSEGGRIPIPDCPTFLLTFPFHCTRQARESGCFPPEGSAFRLAARQTISKIAGFLAMDILIHTLSGLCAGTAVAALHRCRPAQQARIVLVGGLGGMFPDIDTFSLWPGFDQTLGAWLGQSGRAIYASHLWYGHHGFFHSLLGVVCCTLLIGGLFSLLYAYLLRRAPGPMAAFRYLVPYQLSFAGGYLLHLLGDMPTPGGPWGGIRLLFPSSTYLGGWGYTWWWNNYDVFLILVGTLVLSILTLFLCERYSRRLRFLPLALLLYGASLSGYQLLHRQTDFNQCAYPVCEEASWEEQKQVIGEDWTRRMAYFDQLLPVYF